MIKPFLKVQEELQTGCTTKTNKMDNKKTPHTPEILSRSSGKHPKRRPATRQEAGARIDDLVGCERAWQPLDRELIQAVVDSNDKKRFAMSEDG